MPELSAMLLLQAQDAAHVDRLLADDPFVSEGLLTELRVVKWDPGFGQLSQHAG